MSISVNELVKSEEVSINKKTLGRRIPPKPAGSLER